MIRAARNVLFEACVSTQKAFNWKQIESLKVMRSLSNSFSSRFALLRRTYVRDVMEVCLCVVRWGESRKHKRSFLASRHIRLWLHGWKRSSSSADRFSENLRASRQFRMFYGWARKFNFLRPINHELFSPHRDHHQFREPRIRRVWDSISVLNFESRRARVFKFPRIHEAILWSSFSRRWPEMKMRHSSSAPAFPAIE